MTEQTLTAQMILDTAEDVLRRYGPAKATVVDVARALGVSHGSIYRHFPSKAALRDAVVAAWLHRVVTPLRVVVAAPGPADVKLRAWFDALREIKRAKVLDDPEVFTTYGAIVAETREVVAAHVAELIDQIAAIVAEGIAEGRFAPGDPAALAAAVLDATSRFHNPAHAGEWGTPENDAAFEGVWRLVIAGLRARPD
ncbi:TetR/AcrR family transcriptional regulator [Siculibacillus lacustris]|uniref:TetR/AcrR family transcriptional regulator n=1 Tax=Siculibacillus lacustris TaxID=1549641 RepID=A0A4Q9VHQ9_9HYPH|nr:TetR family transcriptional regulator [Siculibacillus lacustris]TBW34707.1 TetR/AcrR family transcriptional regulator [Siculibacillus lacustris]